MRPGGCHILAKEKTVVVQGWYAQETTGYEPLEVGHRVFTLQRFKVFPFRSEAVVRTTPLDKRITRCARVVVTSLRNIKLCGRGLIRACGYRVVQSGKLSAELRGVPEVQPLGHVGRRNSSGRTRHVL